MGSSGVKCFDYGQVESSAELEKAACGECAHFFRIEDILVQKSRIYFEFLW